MHMHNEEMPSKENISPVRRYLQIDFVDVFLFIYFSFIYLFMYLFIYLFIYLLDFRPRPEGSIRPSFRLSVFFLRIGSLVFSET